MMAVPLAKERLTEEQYRNVSVGITRAKALAKTEDPLLAAEFAVEAKASSERGNIITAQLSAMPLAPEEVAILQTLNATRKAYIVSRDSMMKTKQAGEREEATRIYADEYSRATATYLASVKAYSDWQHVAIDKAAVDVDKEATTAQVWMTVLGGVTLLLGAMLAWVLTKSITGPLGRAAALADSVANGDLSQDLVTPGTDEISRLMTSLSTMNASLAKVVARVRSDAESVATASSEISQGNNDLSCRTEQQASALEQTSAAMETLSSTVKQNAQNSLLASQFAATASIVATSGANVVQQIVGTMRVINDSFKEIFDIIEVVDSIAFQTNILALNAAVEAARAGEQGRGFAVVASEVRSLARSSAEAAKRIKTLILASVERVNIGTALVGTAGTTMTDIVESIGRVRDLAAEISSASAEQSTGIMQVGEAISQMDRATQQNSALVEESAAAAEGLKH